MPAPRRRRAPARLRPQEVAAQRGTVSEGLAWLGRDPEPTAGPLVRVLRFLLRFVCQGLLRLRLTTSGREHLPAGGGCIVAAAVHRSWIDPLVIAFSLPAEPKPWFLGSGATAFRRRWLERLLHRTGMMLPVWRGGVGIDQHVAAARAVIEAGSVFVMMPEGTIGGPPDSPTPLRGGTAVICLRTGAPIVPLAVAGAEELYLGKRMASRILPPLTAAELAGEAWTGSTPPPGSREELAVARAMTDRLEAILAEAVAEIWPPTVDPQSHPRRLRERLTNWF
ncbi:MAG: 1-acyl-sn-glycerol-3-phosphate acyltransferase [Chloroflexi bacterium]|nr:1-acyl-sn-glycerol-3-phosphate acyltransferase [Chloroflexota bacterium]